MIVNRVNFTGLELSPADVADRWHRGIIPLDWERVCFPVPGNVDFPISTANRWLFSHTEGRWAVTMRFAYELRGSRELTVAFEYAHDAVTFTLSDGQIKMFQEQYDH